MKNYILLIITLFCLSACQDFLDETPKGTLIPKTVNDFGMILDNYGYDNNIAYGQCLTMMMSDDFIIPDDKAYKFASWGINGYTWADYLVGASDDEDCYNNFYHVIYLCNYILNNLAGAPDGTEFTRSYVEGAARFHRAFAYFSLVNLYSKHYDKNTASSDLGVPLVLDADPNTCVGRATVQQVYDLILDDLDKAKGLLGKENPHIRSAPTKRLCMLFWQGYICIKVNTNFAWKQPIRQESNAMNQATITNMSWKMLIQISALRATHIIVGKRQTLYVTRGKDMEQMKKKITIFQTI